MNLEDYFYDNRVPGHNPNSRVFSVVAPGEDILDDDLRPMPNPKRDLPGRGLKLSTEEANDIRNTTLESNVFCIMANLI